MNDAVFDFVRFKDDSGSTHALRKRGRKYNSLVIIDHPIYVLRVPIGKSEGIVPIERDLAEVVAQFAAAAGRRETTEAARTILEEAGK